MKSRDTSIASSQDKSKTYIHTHEAHGPQNMVESDSRCAGHTQKDTW